MGKNTSLATNILLMIAFGGIFLCVGLIIVLVSLDVLQVPDENFHAPRWVVTAAGMTFGMGGVMVVISGLKEMIGPDSVALHWLSNGIALVFMFCLAVPFHWVAFGPGERHFSSTVGVGPVSFSGNGRDIVGRIVFGFFAVLMDLFMLFILSGLIAGEGRGGE